MSLEVDMLSKKLDMLKVEFGHMQKEVSEVIGEMHQGLTAMMNSLRLMTLTYNARLEELEKQVAPSETPVAEKTLDSEGKEL